MQEIKFSHPYRKLLGSTGKPIENAVLLMVAGPMDIAEFPDIFIKYDTDEGKYKLEPGKYILLVFAKVETPIPIARNVFTTMRRYTDEKARFYVSQIGKPFKVTITPA